MKGNDKFIWVIFSLLICSMFFWHFYSKNEIKEKYVMLECRILSIASTYRSAPTFQCEIFYKGEIKIVTSNTNVDKNQVFIGKRFLFAYSPKINIGEILVTPEDFKDYNIPFPDSLNWVLKYRY
jgi:hypothetical protein